MPISTPGKSGLQRSSKGITLIELMVAMAIVGLIFALAATGLRTALNVELKSSSRSLGSLIRYLRIKSITEHKYLRLTLDLDSREYWAEVSPDPAVIAPEEDPGERKKKPAAEGEETTQEEKSKFEEIDDELAKKSRLGSGVFFKDVTVSYQPVRRESGQVHLYFFPDGYVTRALINLRDEDDEDHFSLGVNSLSGKVTIEGSTREWEKE